MTIEQSKTKMGAVIEHLKTELKSIRTGRANPGFLDGVQVESFGSMVKLKAVGNVTLSDPRTLLVTPFDPSMASTIGKAIEKANLGVQVVIDGNAVRIKVPSMDSAVRQEMVKLCKRKAEEAKISIRNIRRDGNEAAKKAKASGELTEDQQKRAEKQIQEHTDKFCAEVDTLCAEKEKEVLAV